MAERRLRRFVLMAAIAGASSLPVSAAAQECFPECRAGYVCQAGQCVADAAAPPMAPPPPAATAAQPTTAPAAPPPAAAVEAEQTPIVQRGLVAQLAIGMSDTAGARYGGGRNTSPGIAFQLGGWFRPLELLSLGVELHFNTIGTGDFDGDGFETSMNVFDVAAGARFHLPLQGEADVYAGVLLGYTELTASSEGADGSTSSSQKGLAVGPQIGGELYVTPNFSLGLQGRFVFPVWLTICSSYDGTFGSGDSCEDPDEATDGRSEDLANLLWTIGATASLRLPL